MPMKWTPENDQMHQLLLKILETHEIHIDTKKISASWPEEKGEVPTARAITERLVKIRKDSIKNGGGNHFGISSSQSKTATKAGAPRSGPPTPRKTKMAPPSCVGNSIASPSPTKRKHESDLVEVKVESVENDDYGPTRAPQRQVSEVSITSGAPSRSFSSPGTICNAEGAPVRLAVQVGESPTKKARAASAVPKKWTAERVGDGGDDSDACEFLMDEEAV